MITFQTTDQKEMRRYRIAQFNGRPATVRAMGGSVTGQVHAIVPSKSGTPGEWTISIIPDPPRTAAKRLRSSAPVRAFADDLY